MKIELHTILIKDLIDGFVDKKEEGVFGYGGKLNIRPPFQREFVYDLKEQKAVIESIFKGYSLNVMYWIENDRGTYELLDGQQRTLSICVFSKNTLFLDIDDTLLGYNNLNEYQLSTFLNYPLQIYICKNGTDTEILKWFETINIAGKKLSHQELLNALYTGPWLSDAKLRFSKTQCVAWKLGQKYINGSPINQVYLETVLKWISNNDVKTYMAKHQHDKNSDKEWQYFQRVIAWVESLFPRDHYRREMKGLAWGELYNKYKDIDITASYLENEVERLMMDDDITNKRGIYYYVLSHDERKLNIRTFTPAMKRAAYERQKGICSLCGKHFEFGQMQGDHIVPWSRGGTTTADNCQMLCQRCNATRGNH